MEAGWSPELYIYATSSNLAATIFLSSLLNSYPVLLDDKVKIKVITVGESSLDVTPVCYVASAQITLG